MLRLVPIVALLLLMIGCAAPERTGSYRQISMDDAIEIMETQQDYIILDVRTQAE